jgi:hypothetical protein
MRIFYADETYLLLCLDDDEGVVCVLNSETSNNVEKNDEYDYIEQSQIYYKKGNSKINDYLDIINSKTYADVLTNINNKLEKMGLIAIDAESNERHLLSVSSDEDLFECVGLLDQLNEEGFNSIGPFVYNTEFDKVLNNK